MRAAVDATPLSLTSGGLCRYTEALTRALRCTFPDDEFNLLYPRPGRWWSLGLPRHLLRIRADVFHGTNFAVPYLPVCPSVLTLHDLSLWMDPGWHAGPNRERKRAPLLLGLGLATMVITHTEAVRRQAIQHFRLHAGRVAVVPLGTDMRPTAPARRDPYFLFVGTLEPRKNLPLLVEAWRQLRKRHAVDLVVAGRARYDAPPIRPEPGLCVLGEVPDSALPGLYSGAAAFCYPSLYEGFGLPVLEAMACGACVLTSKDPALEEVAGGAAVHLDPDPSQWIEAMRCVLELPGFAARMQERALRRAAEFNWETTARLTRDVYVEAIRRA